MKRTQFFNIFRTQFLVFQKKTQFFNVSDLLGENFDDCETKIKEFLEKDEIKDG